MSLDETGKTDVDPNMSSLPWDRPSYSVRRYYIDEFFFRHVPALPTDSLILDVGGNKIRKRGVFDIEQYELRVVYADLSAVKRPDTQADASYLPFADSRFEAVICSELLEHVYSPPSVLREAHRVLKPGGKLIATVPFLYREHGDPYDYGRYTDQFWRPVLYEIGFRDIVVEPQGLFFSVLADFLKQYMIEVGIRGPFRRIARQLMPRFQRWALRREQQPPASSNPFVQSFTTGYGITAIKKASDLS